jgi:hypothetical protein
MSLKTRIGHLWLLVIRWRSRSGRVTRRDLISLGLEGLRSGLGFEGSRGGVEVGGDRVRGDRGRGGFGGFRGGFDGGGGEFGVVFGDVVDEFESAEGDVSGFATFDERVEVAFFGEAVFEAGADVVVGGAGSEVLSNLVSVAEEVG